MKFIESTNEYYGSYEGFLQKTQFWTTVCHLNQLLKNIRCLLLHPIKDEYPSLLLFHIFIILWKQESPQQFMVY